MKLYCNRILRGQLVILFVAATLSVISFVYHDALPDNVYSISSNNDSLNLISYGLSSAVAFTGYYTGIFLFPFFILFGLLYAFLYSRRSDFLDVLNFFLWGASFALGAFYLYPDFLGKGLNYFLKSLPVSSLLISAVFFPILAVWGTFRNSFGQSFRLMKTSMGHLGRFLYRSLKKVGQLRPSHFPLKASQLKFNFNLRDRLSTFLKKEEKENGPEYSEDDFYEEEPKQLESEIGEEYEYEEEDESEYEEEEELTETPAMVASPKKSKPTPPLLRTQDLIACLNNEGNRGKENSPDQKYFKDIIQRIEEKLQEFRIKGDIVNILKGPVVDTFELELGAGVKVSKVTSLTEDLSLALYGAPIRIVYPMRGRTTVGIEVPRNPREFIYLQDVLETDEYTKNRHRLPLAMGKDAFGETQVVDLASMPHMLVAGATGAGKSVFINSILVSLLVKKSPEKMKLILIDPKQLELALYQRLPHLLLPVITDGKTASLSLMWACQEMDRRYAILKELGVRNIEGFNDRVVKKDPRDIEKIEKYFHGKKGYELPFIVIIVDEFADLILTKAGKEIENNICRLAAKARAAGIHLILATQRPSVDVITGLIKSNFPTRVSFRVTSNIDSRTILNSMGAEKLLGKGDMLFKHGIEMSRLHSAFVDENDIEALVNRLSEVPSEFNPEGMRFLEEEGRYESDEFTYTPTGHYEQQSSDPLYDEAVKVAVEYQKASASMLQRRLGVGYNRAANLIETMEERGIVGPQQGSKPRKVLSARL